tara:strand:+ start:223 stop:633 length:411 start_codon:yes stop_codon:yes gene_type:complete
MNNLFNIPGLIFKGGDVFLNNKKIYHLDFTAYNRGHQKLQIEFLCPENPQDIKNLIVDYKMENVFEFSSSGEKRYETTIRGINNFRVVLVLDVPTEKFLEMLDLTDCFQANGTAKSKIQGSLDANEAYLTTFFELV